MKVPKSILKAIGEKKIFVESISFRSNGQTKKGFAIVDSDNNELVEIEPCHYSNGDRWKVTNRIDSPNLIYLKSLKEFNIELRAAHTGYKFSAYNSHGKILNSGYTVKA